MASKKKTAVKVNKTQFVLEHPKLPAKEVVAVAKKAGVTLSEKYVYNIRAKAKANGGSRRKPGRPPSKVNGSKRAALDTSLESTIERTFVNMALDLGLGRAEMLLHAVRNTVAAVTA